MTNQKNNALFIGDMPIIKNPPPKKKFKEIKITKSGKQAPKVKKGKHVTESRFI